MNSKEFGMNPNRDFLPVGDEFPDRDDDCAPMPTPEAAMLFGVLIAFAVLLCILGVFACRQLGWIA